MDACQSSDLQAVWDKYETKIKVAKADHKGGAYCQGDNIYVNIALMQRAVLGAPRMRQPSMKAAMPLMALRPNLEV